MRYECRATALLVQYRHGTSGSRTVPPGYTHTSSPGPDQSQCSNNALPVQCKANLFRVPSRVAPTRSQHRGIQEFAFAGRPRCLADSPAAGPAPKPRDLVHPVSADEPALHRDGHVFTLRERMAGTCVRARVQSCCVRTSRWGRLSTPHAKGSRSRHEGRLTRRPRLRSVPTIG